MMALTRGHRLTGFCSNVLYAMPPAASSSSRGSRHFCFTASQLPRGKGGPVEHTFASGVIVDTTNSPAALEKDGSSGSTLANRPAHPSSDSCEERRDYTDVAHSRSATTRIAPLQPQHLRGTTVVPAAVDPPPVRVQWKISAYCPDCGKNTEKDQVSVMRKFCPTMWRKYMFVDDRHCPLFLAAKVKDDLIESTETGWKDMPRIKGRS
ncbi:unnamed protein product [Amoebophrya sp. A120]|nr:unnamed protein product [Amoebophrya sp. A120]|eukprot:GSA120T00009454001.1